MIEKSDAFTFTKEEVIKVIEANIAQYTEIKEKIIQTYVENNASVEKYANKLKGCKEAYSKQYYGKKLDRFRADAVELLEKADQCDRMVENMKKTLVDVLNPPEDLPVAVETSEPVQTVQE